MIATDASAIVAALLNSGPQAELIRARIEAPGQSLHAPHLLDLEVLQTVRRYALRGALTPERGSEALRDFSDFIFARYPHTGFLPRIWELRENISCLRRGVRRPRRDAGRATGHAGRPARASPRHPRGGRGLRVAVSLSSSQELLIGLLQSAYFLQALSHGDILLYGEAPQVSSDNARGQRPGPDPGVPSSPASALHCRS